MTNEKNTWGGKRPGSGRKEGAIIDPEQKKAHRIVVMCTKEQCDRFTQNAKNEGLTASGYLLKKANKGGLRMSLDFDKLIELQENNIQKQKELNKRKDEENLKKTEKEYTKYIEFISDEMSENKIINANKINKITENDSENVEWYEITFNKDNEKISQVCAFLLNKVRYRDELKESWKDLTIQEFGYAVIGKQNSHWKNSLDKNFDAYSEIDSYTLYFINPDRKDLYEKKFSQLS